MIGTEKNSKGAAFTDGAGLIRSVTLVESVISYVNSDQLINVTLNAVLEKNNMIILRTVGFMATYIWRTAQRLTLLNFDLLAIGESVIIKLEQNEGLGNAELVMYNSALSTIGYYQISPAGTYLITRNSNTIGFESGFTIVCIDDGSSTTFKVPTFIYGRRVGFSTYYFPGGGNDYINAIFILPDPGPETGKITLCNNGQDCVVRTISNHVVARNGLLETLPILTRGVHVFYYSNYNIFLK